MSSRTSNAATSSQASGSAQSVSVTGSQASATASGSVTGNATLSIPQTAPAGALSITQPPQTSVAFFKIASGQPITFAWSFTDVLATPTSLTVSAVCANGITYPVGPTNGIIPGTASSVVWDVYEFQQSNKATPLPQSTYTLNIYDERGPGAARGPGLLSPNSNLRFALYSPQPYTPIASGWQCSGCNIAAAEHSYSAHPAFVSVLVTILVMVMSGFALLRNGVH